MSPPLAPRASSTDLELLGKVARLHYEYGLTHQEVAAVLHVSRVKVTRMLRRARELGIVQIRVTSDASPFAVLETELSLRFELEEAIVVPEARDQITQRAALARAAARYLQRILSDGTVVAIGLSRTVAMISQFIVDPRPVRPMFVAMSGGLRKVSLAANPYEATEGLAQRFGGVGEHLHAPAIVGSRAVARALLRDPAAAEVLERAAAADVALLGIGPVSHDATLVEQGELTLAEMDELIAAGAVGDLAGRFFSSDGRPTQHALNDRVIALTLDQVNRIPLRIVVAGGTGKGAAIGAALRGRLPTVLIVDAASAESILAGTHGQQALVKPA